ncbi:MAG: aldolase catalytic domain-containing protein [Deltaproteobacteria bacterium]|nr:aldolase catalytic domain-containing protein [Deltaproteobacteria bacterium]MBN2670126.1 aldolase catalytic domain-containing protein [Deltaproteobacteria bacterium]
MYRPELKVVDCTIRDGGLMNDSHFPLEMVQNVFRLLAQSGVDMVELGYRNSKKMFDPAKYGPWRFTSDDDIKRVIEGVDYECEIAVMQDAHKAFADDLGPKENSPIDIVRVATYVKDVDKAIHLANNATDKGYKAAINIMAISHVIERELEEALQQIEEESNIVACYIVDSFGALYSEDIDYYIQKFKKYIKRAEIGVHCHNQQQLAFANTIEAIIKNANYVDGTLYGLGRGAGNCPLELLMGFLKNPKFNLAPVLDAIAKDIMPLEKEIFWGYSVPYMLSGILNVHPKEALKIHAMSDDDPKKFDYVGLYERLGEV